MVETRWSSSALTRCRRVVGTPNYGRKLVNQARNPGNALREHGRTCMGLGQWARDVGRWAMQPTAHHKTIMAVDIAGYNDPKRTTAHRLVVHEGFWKLMRTAFAEAGVPWDVLFMENTGDGAMIQLPA